MIGGGIAYSPATSFIFLGFEKEGLLADNNTSLTYLTYDGKAKHIFLPPLIYSGDIKFVVSEHTVLHAGVSFQKIGLSVDDKSVDEYYYDPYNSNPQESALTGSHTFSYARSRYTKFSIGFTHSHATAPVGGFIGNDFVLLLADVDAIDTKGVVHPLGQTVDIGYSVIFGYRRVIADAIVLETSTNFSFYGKGFLGFFGVFDEVDSIEKLKSAAVTQHYFDNIMQLRLSAYYLF
jgi:hypothetical protein